MDLLKDIKNILKDDREHHLKIEMDNLGVRVFLDYDPSCTYEGKMVIPIEYATCEEFAFIPDSQYREKFIVNDYGLDLDEINLIQKIMKYLENNKVEINDLCDGFAWNERKGYSNE